MVVVEAPVEGRRGSVTCQQGEFFDRQAVPREQLPCSGVHEESLSQASVVEADRLAQGSSQGGRGARRDLRGFGHERDSPGRRPLEYREQLAR
jgi:hypothetical protein